MKATQTTFAGITSGEVDGTSAYMSGDLVIEGNLQDAIAYGEIQGLAMELGEEYFE
ncbi:MAG: SCP2 sterol-binding domain-containing protein [Promethearchaeota archaeon]